jgi:hypothetical protein
MHPSAWKRHFQKLNFAITAFSEVRAAILVASFAADLELRWPVQGPEITRRYTEADRRDDHAQVRPIHPAGDHLSQLVAIDRPTSWAVRTPQSTAPSTASINSVTPHRISVVGRLPWCAPNATSHFPLGLLPHFAFVLVLLRYLRTASKRALVRR